MPTYDVRLAKTLEGIDPERPLPALWKEFDALGNVPVMVIRGANSDMLSAATVDAMRCAACHGLDASRWRTRATRRYLAEADTIARIVEFVGRCDHPGH